MTRHTNPSLLYSGTTPLRWLRTVVSSVEGDLYTLCFSQWRNAPLALAPAGDKRPPSGRS
jgi:hypothetical protein